MKNLRTIVCVCITLCSLQAFAQKETIPVNEPDMNRPKLFTNMPDIIPISTERLNLLMNTDLSRQVNTDLSEKTPIRLEGEVVSTATKFNNTLQSVVIRSSNFNGATLTISRLTHPDGTISYSGRLISFHHGDLYELKKVDGNYMLVKKNFYDLVNE